NMSTIGHEHETIRVEQMKTTLQAYLDRFGGGSGYTKSEASLAVGRLDQTLSAEELIKQALKTLARGI
ncbi:MAG: RuvA C-terminal domain-containing protein, partial [Acutalibacteraceae bacterium]|nr:RuvA C-terminal domain-containing protein [Acutalibacteraceae bacterium]